MERREEEIRAGVWVVVVASLFLCGGVLWLALAWTRDDTVAAADSDEELGPSVDDGQWRAASRRRPAREPRPGIAPAAPRRYRVAFSSELASVENDPQLERSRASYARQTDAGVPGFAPLETAGRVIAVSGASPVQVGETCSVRVLPVMASYNCMIRVFCGDALLYPEPEQAAGYASCSLGADGRPAFANDRNITAHDTDPVIAYDLSSGRVVVGDANEDGSRSYEVMIELPSGGQLALLTGSLR